MSESTSLDPWLTDWTARAKAQDLHVGIIGLGYVGLPLALLFAESGFRVTGFDIDAHKVAALNAGGSYIHRITPEAIAAALAAGFSATADFSEASGCNAILICVPTPLAATATTLKPEGHTPDLSFIENTVRALAPHTRAGQLIVLESTTWPGTTEEVVVPLLEQLAPNGITVHRNSDAANPYPLISNCCFVAFSPEREDPGNTHIDRRDIPKVVGGISTAATQAAEALYGAVFARTVAVSSTAAAEMTKLLENIYRAVNIALVNELKQFALAAGIDIWEVIAAASTKPFGFAPFQPGPGIGGHCIPVDPFYLSWRAAQFGTPTRFIELAGEVNEAMPAFVVATTARELAARGTQLSSARVLLLGMAYKRDIDDLRESPALTLFHLFREAGADVRYNDPYFEAIGRGRHYAVDQSCTPLSEVASFDAVVLVTDHSAYDIAALTTAAKLFIDTRNATSGITAPNVVRC